MNLESIRALQGRLGVLSTSPLSHEPNTSFVLSLLSTVVQRQSIPRLGVCNAIRFSRCRALCTARPSRPVSRCLVKVRTGCEFHHYVQILLVQINSFEPDNVWVTELSVIQDFSVDILVDLTPSEQLLHSNLLAGLLVLHQVCDTKISATKLFDNFILVHDY
jgi:hypothetical protein